MSERNPNFKAELKSAVEKHYRALVAKSPEESFYGYALYTTDDVSSFGPVANRESALPADTADKMYHYFRFGVDEWSDWEDFGMFEEVNNIVEETLELQDEDDDGGEQMISQALEVLQELEAAGLFGPKTDKRFVVLWVSDSSHPVMAESVKGLNSREIYAAYALEFPPQ